MDSGKLVVLGLIGFGVYEYWDKLKGMFGVSTSPISLPTSNLPTTTGNRSGGAVVSSGVPVNIGNQVLPYDPVNTPMPQTDLYSQLRRYVASNPNVLTNGKATFDTWNWIALQGGVTLPGIEDIFPGMDRSNPLSIDEYWVGINSAGLSGWGRRNGKAIGGGLGMIFDTSEFLAYYNTNKMLINGKEYV